MLAMRRNSLECFGLGFFGPNTYFYRWIPFFYSQTPLLSIGYAISNHNSSSAINNTASSSSSVVRRNSTSSSSSLQVFKGYKLQSSSFQIPHPEKAYSGGEDAYFIYEDSAIGVADGVGGWAEVGVDSSVYSNALMNYSKQYFVNNSAQNLQLDNVDPSVESLQYGYEQCLSITGSSTGIIAAVVGTNVKICNIGDSKGLLLRFDGNKYQVQESTTEQTYKFNFPYQLGTGSDSSPKRNGQKYEWAIQDGDLLILGSDGLFDNLWNEDIANLVTKAGTSADTSKLAQMISLRASEVSEDSYTSKTPWAVGAKAAGKRGSVWTGGKMDDITVVVSKVIGVPSSSTTLDSKL